MKIDVKKLLMQLVSPYLAETEEEGCHPKCPYLEEKFDGLNTIVCTYSVDKIERKNLVYIRSKSCPFFTKEFRKYLDSVDISYYTSTENVIDNVVKHCQFMPNSYAIEDVISRIALATIPPDVTADQLGEYLENIITYVLSMHEKKKEKGVSNV